MRREAQPLSDVDQRELARVVGKHDSDLLELVYGTVNVRLLTDDEFTALSTALAVDADDPDAAEADRLAAVLAQHTAGYWAADMSERPLRERLPLADRQRLIAFTRSHSPGLLSAAHAVNVRWLSDAEVDALADMLLDVFGATLDGTDEPSEPGAEADRLAGLLHQHRLAYWEEVFPQGLVSSPSGQYCPDAAEPTRSGRTLSTSLRRTPATTGGSARAPSAAGGRAMQKVAGSSPFAFQDECRSGCPGAENLMSSATFRP